MGDELGKLDKEMSGEQGGGQHWLRKFSRQRDHEDEGCFYTSKCHQ